MPARVHALLVVRPDGREAADIRLQRTLTALRAQSRPVDALTIILCDSDAAVQDAARASHAEAVIGADRGTSLADALALGSHRLDGDAVWVLTHDTVPGRHALARLAGALEAAPSVAFAAPKLVRSDEHDRIVSLGVSMTALGRTVGLADGEHDQGQYDGAEDVLGSDIRGILVRSDAWTALGGADRALAGADEGLDLGVRARLHGGRIVLAPRAVVAVSARPVGPMRAAYAARTAQLHRRLAYAPTAAVPLHWLTLLPLAIVRSLAALLGKRPGSILPEWGAAVTAMVRPAAVARTRRGIRRGRAASWAQIAPLRVTAAQLRHRLDDDLPAGTGRTELHFFSGGGAWIVLAALVASVVSFVSLLAWPVLSGGALAPLRATVAGLWADAASGARPLGWQTVGPADPFGAVIALLGTLAPVAPARAMVVLWVLALPLAALGGWFAATRFSERAIVRAVVAVGWALAPSLLGALTAGRPTVVIAHLLLPWLVWAASVAHRSWSAAGVASILAAAVLACAPSLAPAFAGVWIVGVLLVATVLRGRGLTRVIWLVVPSIVVFAPLVWARLSAGEPWSLLADPGVPLADPAGADGARRMLLALGFPASDGWGSILPAAIAAWTPLLVAPVLLLAVAGLVLGRTIPAAVLGLTGLLGLVTALTAIGVAVASDGPQVITLFPGAALSLFWIATLGAAALALDALPGAQVAGARIRGSLAVLAMAALAVSAVPALTATLRGDATITEGTTSTLPAYVEAEGRGGTSTATFVLTPTEDGAVIADVVWGETASLGGQSTLRSARTGADEGDERASVIAAQLVSDPEGPVISDLAAHGVAFVVLAPGADSDAARAVRLVAGTALDQRSDLEVVGETAKGTLWRIIDGVVPRPAVDASSAWRIALLQAGVILAALLLALPTRRSLEESRRRARVVGLPRRRPARWVGAGTPAEQPTSAEQPAAAGDAEPRDAGAAAEGVAADDTDADEEAGSR
ncbi:glycosyltransferase [Microbacterium flavum]|uniref:Glycosyltransferase n=1 Tax=Microbacterium flavum TaxID=415216 RepID=A0ABS5XUN0_9MICO|nr:glycosyltransferase [Microbacterium flavum]MBT8798237.1 glycosyltransferase [Microbacterium flavum]